MLYPVVRRPGKEEIKSSSGRDISYVDENFLEQKIKERSGKLLFVNVWATWCVPCVEEFPDLVKIYNDYRDKDIEFLSFSVDFGNKADSLVGAFLKLQNAHFPVYIVKEESSENFINLLSSEWSGAVPATFIYDRKGSLVKYFSGAHSYREFKEGIDSLTML